MKNLDIEKIVQSFLQKKRLNIFLFIFLICTIYAIFQLLIVIKHDKYIYKYKFNYEEYIFEVDNAYKGIIQEWSQLNNFFYPPNNLDNRIKHDITKIIYKDFIKIEKILSNFSHKNELYFDGNELNIIFYSKEAFNIDEKFHELNIFIISTLIQSLSQYLDVIEGNIQDQKSRYKHLIITASQCFNTFKELEISIFCSQKEKLLIYEFFYVKEIISTLMNFQNYKFHRKPFFDVHDDFFNNTDHFQIEFEQKDINYFDNFHLKILFALFSTILILLILNYTLAILNLVKPK